MLVMPRDAHRGLETRSNANELDVAGVRRENPPFEKEKPP
jgi:hypothetical protein